MSNEKNHGTGLKVGAALGTLALMLGACALDLTRQTAATDALDEVDGGHPALSGDRPLATISRTDGCVPQEGVPVFLFHGICQGACASTDTYSIEPATFDAILSVLSDDGFSTISIDEFVSYVNGKSTPKSRSALITFDDSRSSAFLGATPILAAHSMRATMFVITGSVGQSDYFMSWPDVVAAANGPWDLGLHASFGHHLITAGYYADGGALQLPFYAAREFFPDGIGEESLDGWRTRIDSELAQGFQMLEAGVPNAKIDTFAVPYGNYGQISTNDAEIPPALRTKLDASFSVWFTQPIMHPNFATPFREGESHERYRFTVEQTTTVDEVKVWLKTPTCP